MESSSTKSSPSIQIFKSCPYLIQSFVELRNRFDNRFQVATVSD
ncbi:hypothetical protein LEP1GSC016_2649 [Leptospira borgpetersenii serovar Hardjo-bovis str. Sponselee]|uniref:Uncharacterized protein n=1 Tax=Leptospira borgpetersenii serovar Hardjo-bovis str. Sponselee TaxID=1303729 RepID=M6BQQ2_LEPBO|nr:hypothetical protein LEP1GSC016_2649 [Leptospira borgpetersenii serovar Hardjo-bovis str. Sponselee]